MAARVTAGSSTRVLQEVFDNTVTDLGGVTFLTGRSEFA